MASEEQDNINIILFKSSNNKSSIVDPSMRPNTICELDYNFKHVKIRNINFDELDALRLTWVKQEGWPTIRNGLPATYSLDQAGFYIMESHGKKIASISVVAYPSIKLAYIGFYIVLPELRGQGYGKLILKKTLEYTEQFRGIESFGLNCIQSMVPMYEKFGFVVKMLDGIWKYTSGAVIQEESTIEIDIVSDVDENFFNNIVDYDAKIFGAKRAEYLYSFMHKPNTITVVYQEDGNVQGYGIISERDPTEHDKVGNLRVGPLYAEDQSTAKLLLRKLMQSINLKKDQAIFLETPGNNPKAAKLVQELGFEKIMDFPKMYKGQEPKQAFKQMFAYSSLVTGG